MAEKPYIVAYDIKTNGAGGQLNGRYTAAELEKQGALLKTSIGGTEYETNGLYKQIGGDIVATCKLVEVAKAESAAEAIEVVRKFYPEASTTAARAVIEPNVNFKLAT
jgi:hypothetical protein